MAKLGINTGSAPNAGDGDTLFAGAVKINSNFDEIYTFLGAGSTDTLSAPLWQKTDVGINTLTAVGIGTTDPGLSTLAIVNQSSVRFSLGKKVDGSGQDHFGIYYGVQASKRADIFNTDGELGIWVDGASDTDSKFKIGRGFGPEFGGEVWLIIDGDGKTGIGTINPRFNLEVGPVGASGTSLWVNGDARVTGILTIGTSSIVLDGSSNTITVGSGVTIDGQTGIISATALYVGGSPIVSGGSTAETIDITDTNGLTTIYYPTFVENRTTGQYLRADVDLTYRTDDNILIVPNISVGTGASIGQLNVSGVSTFTGIATFKNATCTTELGNQSYDGIRFLGSGSNFARVSGNSSGDLDLYSESTRSVNINSGAIFFGSSNVQLNNGDVGTTKVGSAITFTANTGNISASSINVGTGGTIITTTAGLVGIGTTNPVSGYNLTLGNDSSLGRVSNSLKVHGYGDINGLIIKGNSTNGTAPYYTDNVVITQHPASTFTGGGNVAIGDYSFTKPGAAGETVALGYYTLNSVGNNITGSSYVGNTGVGAFAGQDSTTTVYNTLIGWSAGRYITTGDYNVILGSYDGNSNELDIRTSNNNVVLSDGQGNIRLYANSSGNVGIGTTNPTQKLEVSGSVKVGIDTSQGVILTSPNGTKYQLFVENDGTLKTVSV